jgi:hypothetical protein
MAGQQAVDVGPVEARGCSGQQHLSGQGGFAMTWRPVAALLANNPLHSSARRGAVTLAEC